MRISHERKSVSKGLSHIKWKSITRDTICLILQLNSSPIITKLSLQVSRVDSSDGIVKELNENAKICLIRPFQTFVQSTSISLNGDG